MKHRALLFAPLLALSTTALLADNRALPPIPKALPRSGVTAKCPSQEVLAKDQPWQTSEASRMGYFNAARIIGGWQLKAPSASMREYFRTRHTADEAAAYTWGHMCTYPNDPGVKGDFDAQRKWFADRGVKPEVDEGLHTLMIDANMVHDHKADICRPDMAITDGASLVNAQLCELNSHTIVRQAWNLWDRGESVELAAAAVVIACEKLHDVGENDTQGLYLTWRLCEEATSQLSDEKVKKALEGVKVHKLARWNFLLHYQAGAAAVTKLVPMMQKHEKGYVGDKQALDEGFKQVREKYAPAFAKWRPLIDEVQAWYASLDEGPAMIEGCRAKLMPMLQKYVDAAVPKAKGDALLDALKDPVGFHVTQALGHCFAHTDDAVRAAVVNDHLIAGAPRLNGAHDGLLYVVERALESHKYKYTSNWISGTWLGGPNNYGPAGAPSDREGDYHGVFTDTDPIAGVKKSAKDVVITFAKKAYKGTYLTDCREDYSHIRSIDAFGNVHYDLIDCKEKTESGTTQKPPLLLPPAEGARADKGMTIAYARVPNPNIRYDNPNNPPQPSAVVWLRRGKDVISALGINAK